MRCGCRSVIKLLDECLSYTLPVVLCTLIAAGADAQQPAGARSDTIRGRVTTDSGVAVPGATVIATMAPTLAVERTLTDSAGRFEIRFDSGSGDYLVYAAPLGYKAFRKRVLRASNAAIVVDIHLVPARTVLPAVQSVATRTRPAPDGGVAHDPAGLEFNTSGLVGLLSPGLQGDLRALAQTIPGISVAADGSLVAFGMPGQVSTTMNGMAFAGTTIPPDALAQVHVTTTAYDPTIGGFAGGRINVELGRGRQVPVTFGRVTFDGSRLQFGDAAASTVGDRFSHLQLSGNADGPIAHKDFWYNTALQVTRQTASPASLLTATPGVLQRAGLGPSVIPRLSNAASVQGLPLGQSDHSDRQTAQGLSFVGRIDHFADPAKHGKPWENATSLTTYAALDEADVPGSGVATVTTSGRRTRSSSAQMVGQWIHIADNFTSELTASLGGTWNSATPNLDLPAARLQVASGVDGDSLDEVLNLGSTQQVTGQSSSGSWETVGLVQLSAGRAHRIKLYARSLVDDISSMTSSGQRGLFTYTSLADFENNIPVAFQRTLAVPRVTASAWRGAAAIGDLWQLTPTFQLEPGIRLEANRILTAPEANLRLEDAFGVSNAHVPNSVHASPRLGFVWTYAPTLALNGNTSAGSAATGRIALPVRGVLSGGIGEFRSDLATVSLLNYRSATGLPGGARGIDCFGSAAPRPNWSDYVRDPSSIPTACSGAADDPLVDSAPGVHLFDGSYDLPRSWRANLRWGSVYHVLHYAIDAAYSYNVDQPGTIDLNFAGQSMFALSNEGGRPVFVPPTSIVAASGVVSPPAARRDANFGRVVDHVSDLRSRAAQATVTLVPTMDNGLLSIAYTLGRVTSRSRGFDATTFSSPLVTEQGRSPFDIRHSILIQTGYRFPAGIAASMFWHIQSGIPYTPLVSSDINGDGLANDRAFVFAPSAAGGSPVGNAMRDLMARAPSAARKCLLKQRGRAARPNSCEGPWTATMNAAISSSSFHVLDRRLATVSLNLTNPLGGLDELLHGSRNLHGWGAAPFPDQTLLNVRSFDPLAKQFTYSVNPRFGSTAASETVLRSPFRLTLSVRVELGTPLQQQEFKRFLEVNPARQNFERAPIDSLRSRLSFLVGNAYFVLLARRDSLLLTRDQVDALSAANQTYRTRADSVWLDLAEYIGDHSTTTAIKDVGKHIDDAIDRVWAMQREEVPRMMAVLLPAQQVVARDLLDFLIDPRHRLPSPHIF